METIKTFLKSTLASGPWWLGVAIGAGGVLAVQGLIGLAIW